jgi:hypothetical protein
MKKKKKKSITIWGYNEGSNLATTTTVPQISIEVFWQVNFEPLTIPPNCDGFFFFLLHPLPFVTAYNISKGEPKSISHADYHS